MNLTLEKESRSENIYIVKLMIQTILESYSM